MQYKTDMDSLVARVRGRGQGAAFIFCSLLLLSSQVLAQTCGGGVLLKTGDAEVSTDVSGHSRKSQLDGVLANVAPSVYINNILPGATFISGQQIVIAAVASDADGSVARVDFYKRPNIVNGVDVLIGTDAKAPYSYTWAETTPGNYILTAKVTDNDSCSAFSSDIPITVVAGVNASPAITLLTPSNGSAFTSPASISLTASASDSDGIVTKVEFFNGATLIGSDGLSPYSFSWTNVSAGSYTLTAKATDDGGAVTTSAAATVTVAGPLPTVSLTSPTAGSSFNDPASITLTANASITSGTITKVEFLDGAIVRATDTTSPYSAVWAGGTVGSHSLTARATSSLGTVATSSPVAISITNPAPSVSLTSPSSGASFVAPASITLCATASDSNGTVAKVEFFNGAALIGTDTVSPYCFTWSNVAAGSYSLTAKATDNGSAVTSSAPVTISVVNPQPSVTLTAPSGGSSFSDPASINLSANASIASGSITKVEFLDGVVVVGTDTTAPYSMLWNGATIGSHSLKARATSSFATIATSPAITISVTNPPPSVSLTAPANGASFAAPASITLGANASDSNGSITKVDFFNGATLLGTDTAAPYSFIWNNVVAGSYTLTAKATDNAGATATSSSVAVSVDAPNVPPVVALTAPLQGASFAAPATIDLVAGASDTDGTVIQVEFYNGSTLLATSTVAPYTFKWLSVPAGTYTVTAKALDDVFGSTTSPPVTITVTAPVVPPTVALTAPADGIHVTAPASITLSADASDGDGSISQVEFYNGSILIGADATAPYSFTWAGVSPGTYTLTARAYDDADNSTLSAARTITVDAPLPGVTLTSPLAGTSFDDPASITIGATATTASGTITQVEFLDGAALIGTDTTEPYSVPWNAGAIGSHSLTARATSSLGTVATSAPVSITITNPPPSVALTAPTAGATFAAPASISLNATASDANGSITQVEFFNGATLLGTDTVAPYSFDWTNVSTGSYTLTAKATDNDGAMTVSPPVSVVIDPPANVAPTVSLTAPLSGAGFAEPATINLTADASDGDGSVTQVEFYNGTTLLGTDTVAPYTFKWIDVPAGAYTLTAKALDDALASSTSAAVSVTVAACPPMTVALSAPLNGALFDAPATVNLAAGASTCAGSISKVEFYQGTTLLDTDTTAPFAFPWSPVGPGSYDLTAKAYNTLGDSVVSPISSIVVNAAPSVVLTAPAAGSNATAPADVVLSADASDSDGTISKVEFYNGATLLGTALSAPYTFTWNAIPIGDYTLSAIAYDNRNAATVSAPVSFGVTACAPTVALVAPLDGALFTAPADINLAVGASACAGSSIDHVEIYQNGTLISSDATAPFDYSLPALSPGTYVLGAKAYDTLSQTGYDEVTIVVNDPPQVALSTPVDGSSVVAPGDFVLSATASDSDGTISRVEYFHGVTPLGSATVAPYAVNWLGVGEGTYTLTAIAYDDHDAGTASAPVTVTVTAAGVNEPPTVVMTSPANASVAGAPATWALAANASDSDGSIARVEFYDGANLIATDNTAPYAFNWTGVAAGEYTLTATTYDDRGASATSAPILVTVTTDAPPPPVGPPAADPISDGVGATAGEFRVDESGAATYSIPLFAAPGTAGVTPQMALAYSSQGGDGPLGRGWAISGLSSISRCRTSREAGDFIVNGQPVDGDPAPINFTGTDRFCLDGQRLLAIAPAAATCPAVAGSVVTEYRTELESYQRVCAYTVADTANPRYFTVDRKDGSTSWYGDRDNRTSAATAGNRGDGALLSNASASNGKTISWAQTRFQDSVGNTIDYTYLNDPAGASFPGEQLISEVRYTGKVNLPGQSGPTLDPYAKLVFNYAALPTAEYRRGYLSGSQTWQTQYLQNVESIADEVVLRHYVLDYQTSVSGSGQRELRQITECRDGTLGACLAPTVFNWSTARNAFETSETVAGTDFDKLISSRLGDIDGDGRQDMVWFKNIDNIGNCRSQLFVSFGELDGQGRPTFNKVSQTPYCTSHLKEDVDGAWHLLDYNGDGKEDLFVSTAGADWAVYPSVGRPTAGGEVFQTSQNLLTTLTPVITTFSDQTDRVMLADLNGDGLLDVLYPQDTHRMVRLMERNAQGYGWGHERMIVVADDAGTGPCFGVTDRCGIGGVSTDAGKVVLNDFDGDSRSDLLFSMSYRVDLNKPGCTAPISTPPEQYSVTANGDTMTAYAANTNLIFDPADDFSGTTVCRETHTDMLAARVLAVSDEQVMLGLYQLWELKVTGDFVSNNIKSLRFADFNGDGLTDVALKSGVDIWTTHLNTGRGFNGKSDTLGTLPDAGPLQLIDVNGDGRTDFVYPQESDSGGRPFHARFANADGTFSADALVAGGQAKACETGSCEPALRTHLFADFDADGALDFVRIKTDDPGHYVSRAVATSRYQPRDTVTSLVNGLGATTSLTYLPLTNSEVYRSDAGSRNALTWGRGSPVQDVNGPSYVVAKAESSAPTYANDNATSAVYYRYAGAKAQAGGRGYLGFRAITTIESNFAGQQVQSTTEYLQGFPFTGVPSRSTKHVVSGAYQPGACFGAIGNACFQTAGNPFPAPSGTLISENLQTWQAPAFVPSLQQPIAVETLGTNEKTFEPTSGTLVSHVDTMFAYDVYGNATLTSVDTFAGASTTPLSTVSTANTYVNDTMRWRLGRLADSVVSHTRGTNTVMRSTRFTYDMSGDYSGLLTGEYLQEGYGLDQSLKTLHDYDVFGNKIATYTCSEHFDDVACRSTAIDFNPADPLSIHRYSRTLYDSRGRLVTSTRQPFASGELATQSVIARSPFGDITDVSDVNGTRARSQYGQLGRAQYTWSQTVAGATPGNPGEGIESWTSYRWCGTGADEVDCPTGARFREQVITEGGPTRWSYFDVLGRPLLAAAQSFNAGQVGKDFAASCTYYDARGQVDRASEPFFLSEPASQGEPAFAGGNPCQPASARYWTLNITDVVGRVTQVTQPDGSTNTSAYQGDGVSIVFTDPLGHPRTEVRNVLGELVTSTDSGGLSTQYEYDAIGNLIAVRRDAGRGEILTAMEYDALGRKIAQHDPDAGNWTYEYNALGEQIAQRDTFEDRTSIEQWRDARGRVYQQTSGRDSGPEALHQYQFDTATPGQLSVETSSGAYQAFQGEAGTDTDFRRSFSYDTLGRVIGSVTTIDGQAYSALTAYDDLGRAWRSQDPSSAWLKTEFDARGYAVRLCDSSVGDSSRTCASGSPSTWRETLETDARGNVLAERRGGTDALLLTRFFEASTGRLLDQCAGINCGLLDESYTWDSAGNLSARDKAGQYSETFSYDPLNRLIGTQTSRPDGLGGSTVVASTAQTYDKLGNICSKTIAGQVQDYTYGGRAGCGINVAAGSGGDYGSPHGVTQANGGSFNYDQHGNQTQASYSDLSKNRKIAYTAADQASQISMGDEFAPSLRTRFWYGSDGSRYKREDDAPSSTTKRTLYVGNLEIVSQGGITTYKRYVAGVMVQDVTGSAVTNQFLFHDHIGSVIRAVSANGAVIEGMDYGAFGERRGYTDPTLPAAVPQTTTRGFTGHEMIDGTDVVHMNGRIYDSKLGRFLQADPVIQEPNNPQNFNRYTYVLNNPLSLTDPSGFSFLGKVGGFFKKYGTTIAAIAVAAIAPYAFAAYAGLGFSAAGVAALTTGQLFGAALVGGFASGFISGGTLKSGLFGAFSAAAFFGVGQSFSSFQGKGSFLGSDFGPGAFGAKVLAHGVTGGVMSELQGGKFGSAFAAAGVTEAFSGGIDKIDGGSAGINAQRVFTAAALGGTASVLSGGKFANGAITGAFSRAFNDGLHRAVGPKVRDVFTHSDVVDVGDAVPSEFPEETFEALQTFLDSPVGRKVGLAAIAAGLKIDLERILPSSGFPPTFGGGLGTNGNAITYTTDISGFLSQGGNISEFDGVGLNVFLAHEIGHAAIAATALGFRNSYYDSDGKEFNAVRFVENPFRSFIGVRLRTTYSGMPVPRPISVPPK